MIMGFLAISSPCQITGPSVRRSVKLALSHEDPRPHCQVATSGVHCRLLFLQWRIDKRNLMMTYEGVSEEFLCADGSCELRRRILWCGIFDVKLEQVNYTASGTKLIVAP